MNKRFVFVLLTLIAATSMLLSACGAPATAAPVATVAPTMAAATEAPTATVAPTAAPAATG